MPLRSPFRLPYALLALLLLAACDDAPRKTDSMIFREQAQKQAQVFVGKAQALYSDEVRNAPLEHLAVLNIVSDALNDARGIYERREIANWDHPALTNLEAELDALQPALRRFSSEKLHELVNRTLTLRQLIEETKSLPVGTRNTDTSGMVQMLDTRYNREISACCLEPLGYADHLMLRDLESNRPLIKLIRGFGNHLENVIRDASYADTLRARIDELSE